MKRKATTHSGENETERSALVKPFGRRKNHQCSICGKIFSKAAKLARHSRSHTGEKPYVCEYEGCEMRYARNDHLKRHVAAVHTGERRFGCEEPGCGRGFYEHGHLTRHRQEVHARRYPCGAQGCAEHFHKKRQRRRHRVEVHGEKPAYTCPEEGCKKMLWSANHLQRHKEYHKKKIERDKVIFLCVEPECGESFSAKAELQGHMKQAHPSMKKDYKCSLCGSTFTRRSNLVSHRRVVHDKSHAFPCRFDGCNEVFGYRHVLNRHMRCKHKEFVWSELPFSATPSSSTGTKAKGANSSMAGPSPPGSAAGQSKNNEETSFTNTSTTMGVRSKVVSRGSNSEAANNQMVAEEQSLARGGDGIEATLSTAAEEINHSKAGWEREKIVSSKDCGTDASEKEAIMMIQIKEHNCTVLRVSSNDDVLVTADTNHDGSQNGAHFSINFSKSPKQEAQGQERGESGNIPVLKNGAAEDWITSLLQENNNSRK